MSEEVYKMAGTEIQITYGIGRGDTNVAAFYVALKDAGIHELNFIEEIPIIPKGSSVRLLEDEERADLVNIGDRGDLLYLTLVRNFGSSRGRRYIAFHSKNFL